MQNTTPNGRGERILLIDDEETLVFLCQRSLERLGYQVTGHVDPVCAMEEFTANPFLFDALVTDLSMPGMSGVELARSVLKIRPDIPVVVISGYIRQEDEKAAREIGVCDLILKPDIIDGLAVVLYRVFVAKSSGSVNSTDRHND